MAVQPARRRHQGHRSRGGRWHSPEHALTALRAHRKRQAAERLTAGAEWHDANLVVLPRRRHRRRRATRPHFHVARRPLQGYQDWCEIVALASELIAWTGMLALTGTARRWEPKRLRLRLFSAAGRLARGGRRLRLRLAERWPWAADVTTAVTRLQTLPSG